MDSCSLSFRVAGCIHTERQTCAENGSAASSSYSGRAAAQQIDVHRVLVCV